MLSFLLTLIDDEDDRQKFTTIYTSYERRVFAIAYKYVQKQYDAEEIVQNVFYRLAKNIKKMDTADSLRTRAYVYTVAQNAARSYVTRAKLMPLEISDDTPDEHECFSKCIERHEIFEAAVSIIASMPRNMSDVLVLFYLSDLSVKEISIALDMTVTNVKTVLCRARKRLKSEMKERGHLEVQ